MGGKDGRRGAKRGGEVGKVSTYRSIPQIRPPFCNLSLSTKCRGGLYAGCDILSRAITPPLDREMLSGSMDADFVLALPFHHGDLEPDCVGVSTREGSDG